MNDKKPRPYALLFLLVCTSALVGGAHGWKAGLKLKRIVVEGNSLVEANEIIQLAQTQAGVALYDADLTTIRRNVLAHHYVKDAEVERSLPSTIRIRVVERTPVAFINRTTLCYVDEDGVVLPRASSRGVVDLPVLSGIPQNVPIILGSRVNTPQVTEALQILTALQAVSKDLYHQISEVQVQPGSEVVLYTAESGVPILFGTGNIADKLSRLESVWESLARDRGVRQAEYIDVRFAEQVIVRWNKSSDNAKTSSRGI